MKISIRPHKTKQDRLLADMIPPPPYKRIRLLVPLGLDEAQAMAWAQKEARTNLRVQREQVQEAEEEKIETDPNRTPTLAEFWEGRFAAEYLPSLRPGTRADTGNCWALHIRPVLADQRIDQIDLKKIHELRDSMKGGALKKASSRNKVLQKLIATLRYAADCGIISRDAVPSRVRMEQLPKTSKAVFGAEDLDRMITAGKMKSIEHEVFALLLVHGCLRIGELNALHWSDIDFQAKTMKVQRTEWMGTIQDAPKGHVGTVPLSSKLYDALVRLHAWGGLRSPLVLPAKKREEWGVRHGPGLLISIQRLAAIRGSGPHLIRHSALTLAASRGASPYALQALARHSNMSTTMRYYVHLQQVKVAQEAVSLLEGTPAPSTDGQLPANEVTAAPKVRLVKSKR
ncbi:MAG TPA: site-specific integrase [Nannocystis sp.]